DLEVARAVSADGKVAGRGLLSGAVMDSNSALIPGVTVRATDTATGITRSGITNESGVYVFPSVNPGTYRVSASVPGFQTNTVTGLQVAADASVRQDLRLAVPTINAMVKVTAFPAAMGGVLEQKREQDLPLGGKDLFG